MNEFKRLFPAPPSDWRKASLSDFLERVTTRNEVGDQNILTISAEHGLINQEEFFNRRVASTNVRGYYRLVQGNFAYNKSYSKGYPVGAIRRLDRYSSGVVSPLYICFRPISGAAVDSNFLAHYFDGGAIDWQLADIAKEGARNHGLLNVAVTEFFPINTALPPLSEQKVIAQILDTLDTAIYETEAIITKLKAVKQGLLHDLLTHGIDENGELRPPQAEAPHLYKESPLGWIPKEWEVESIARACSDVIDCTHSTPHFQDQGVLVARTMHIKDGLFLDSLASHVSERQYQERIARLEPKPGDLIFTREAPVGEAFVIPLGMKICLGQRVMLLRPKEGKLEPEFLLAQIYSGSVKDRISTLTSGTTNPHLNVSEVKEFEIPLPPFAEQQVIASRLNDLNLRLGFEIREQKKLELMKSGLMDDLLTGRVRVTPLLAEAAQQ